MLLYIAVVMLLLMFPSQLAMTLTKWAKKPLRKKKKFKDKNGLVKTTIVEIQPPLKPGEIVLCCLPYMSAMMVWKSLYRRYGWTAITSIASIVLIVFRVVTVFFTTNTLLWIISFWAFWIGLLLFHLTYVISYIVTAYMYSMKAFIIIMCLIIPYGMAWYLNNNIPRIMKDIKEEEDDRFKG